MEFLKKTSIFMLAVFATSCTASPSSLGQDVTPTGNPDSSVWVAGDSIAKATADLMPDTFNIAQETTGFLTKGTRASDIGDRIFNMVTEYADSPKTILVIGGGNDLWNGYSPNAIKLEAKRIHDFMETLEGIDIRFVTEPVPPHPLWAPLTEINDWLVATFYDTIDCDEAGYPTSVDNIHPTLEGYQSYIKCIETEIN